MTTPGFWQEFVTRSRRRPGGEEPDADSFATSRPMMRIPHRRPTHPRLSAHDARCPLQLPSPDERVLAPVLRGEGGEAFAIDGLSRHVHGAAARPAAQRRRPDAVLQNGSLAEDGAGADFGDRLAVDFYRHDPIEKQVQVVAGRALGDDRVAFVEAHDTGLRP